MKIMVKKVGKDGEMVEIEHSLEKMQEIVGGYIERVALPENIDMWIDEEGLLKEKPINLYVVSESTRPFAAFTICGDIFFAGHDGQGETVALTEKQIKWLEMRIQDYATLIDIHEKREPYMVHKLVVE